MGSGRSVPHSRSQVLPMPVWSSCNPGLSVSRPSQPDRAPSTLSSRHAKPNHTTEKSTPGLERRCQCLAQKPNFLYAVSKAIIFLTDFLLHDLFFNFNTPALKAPYIDTVSDHAGCSQKLTGNFCPPSNTYLFSTTIFDEILTPLLMDKWVN